MLNTGLSRRRIIKSASALAVGIAAPTLLRIRSALAAYPERPVKIVVPNSPGGPSDIVGRITAAALQQSTGKTFVIENRSGGGANIGVDYAAHALADGYTILVVTSGYSVNVGLFNKLPFDPYNDFVGVSELATSPDTFVVKSELPAKTMKDFVALARANPEKFNVSTPPIGSTLWIQAEVLKIRERLPKMEEIVFKGGGDAIEALLSGTVQLCSSSLPPANPHIKAGTLRCLAVAGESRWPDLPDVPTMQEAGYKDFVFATDTALLAPAKTPPEIVKWLEKQTLKVLSTPETKAKLYKVGFLAGRRAAMLPGRASPRKLRCSKPLSIRPVSRRCKVKGCEQHNSSASHMRVSQCCRACVKCLRWATRQLHIGGRRLQGASLDLPGDFNDTSIGGSRIATAPALLDDETVDHIDLAGAAFQQVLQHGVTAAARTDIAGELVEQLLEGPIGAREVLLRQSHDWLDRIAEVLAGPHGFLANLDDQLAHARQLDRIGQRQADHSKRPKTHRVDDELRPLRRQDVWLYLDPADGTEQRLHFCQPVFGTVIKGTNADPGFLRRRVALHQAGCEHFRRQFDDAAYRSRRADHVKDRVGGHSVLHADQYAIGR